MPTNASLSDAARELLRRPVFAHLATVDADGTPHVTPMWVDVDGDHVVFNTAAGRRKVRNIERSARVGVSVVDTADPYTQRLALEGTVVAVTEEGADAHIDALARKYLGLDAYPWRQPGERRLKVLVRPDRVLMSP